VTVEIFPANFEQKIEQTASLGPNGKLLTYLDDIN
jgi:hypothetical protein